MSEPQDLLQIKIEQARGQLPAETRRAIDAVDWKSVILSMRTSKGFTFEQLSDLETETELLLCGLSLPENYEKELETRMKISALRANELVEEMNKLVFSRMREELVKGEEKNKTPAPETKNTLGAKAPEPNSARPRINQDETNVLAQAGITIHDPDLSKLELSAAPKPITPPTVANKLADSFKTPAVKTEHTLENISKPSAPVNAAPITYPPKADPYRMSPDE